MALSTSRAPSSGERAALAGFTPQYRLAARLTLRALADQCLEWVKVADPEAGRLDDFQIATPRRLDAYQFKWATYPTTVTYNDLTKETKVPLPGGTNTPGLLAQLADGWKRLAVSNPGRRVVVHLVTNENPSDAPNAVLPVGNPPPTDKHLAAFFAQAWPSVRGGPRPPEDAVPARWKKTLVAFQKETGLSDAEFGQFVLDCEFDFGETVAEPQSESIAGRQRQHDLDRLRQLFQDVVHLLSEGSHADFG